MLLFLLYSFFLTTISCIIAFMYVDCFNKNNLIKLISMIMIISLLVTLANLIKLKSIFSLLVFIGGMIIVALMMKMDRFEILISILVSLAIYTSGLNGYRVSEYVNNQYLLVLILLTLFVIFVIGVKDSKYFRLPSDLLNEHKQLDNKEKINRHWYVYTFLVGNVICQIACLNFVNIDNMVSYFVIVIIMSVLNVSCLMVVVALANVDSENNIITTQKMNSEEVSDYMSVIRSQRHDYNFHIQTLNSLLKQEKYDKCKEYIETIVKDSMELNAIMPITDETIAALIHSFIIKAASNNIKIELDLEDDLSHLATNSYETNKIIGNLLQNAIDEVVTHKDKSFGIKLSTLKRGEFCLIHVQNKIKKEVSDDLLKVGYTSKENHQGVGLNSIEIIVKKYNGSLYYRIENDVIHFIASIGYRY